MAELGHKAEYALTLHQPHDLGALGQRPSAAAKLEALLGGVLASDVAGATSSWSQQVQESTAPVVDLSSAHLAPGLDKHILTLALTCSQEKEAGNTLLMVLGRPQAEMFGCGDGSVTQVRSLRVSCAP